VAALLAQDALDIGWQPAVVHTHDWQTGLVAAFLADQPLRRKPFSPFTTSPMAATFRTAISCACSCPAMVDTRRGGIPRRLFDAEGGHCLCRRRHHGEPHLRRRNLHPEFGYGLDGLLLSRQNKLHGILNGIDTHIWNPSTDPHLPAHYSMGRIQPGKRRNKQALLERFLPHADDAAMQAPLLGWSAAGRAEGRRLGACGDAVLLAETDVRIVLLGSGQRCMNRN